MKEKTIIPMTLQLFAESDPPAAPGTTPSQAGTVDIDAIATLAAAKAAEAAEKKNEAVFKSMLQQHNLDPETIAAMTAEYKAKNKPADLPKDPPAQNEETKALFARIEALEKDSAADKAEISRGAQLKHLEKLDIPENQLDFYHFKIAKLVTEDKDFQTAAAEYIKANPPIIKPPAFALGKGKTMSTSTEKEKALADARAAMKVK